MKPKKPTSVKNKNRRNTSRSVFLPLKFSKRQLIVFAIIFGAIGAYIIFRSMAATVTLATHEAETLTQPTGASIVSDASASGGKAILMTINGTANGTVSLSTAATQVSVKAKGTQCSGAPQIVIKVDGTTIQTASVSSSSWTDYTATTSLATGSHSVSVSFTNDFNAYKGKGNNLKCSRDLYVDKISFNGVVPDPEPPVTGTSGKMYWGGRIGYPDLADAPWSAAAWDRFETNAGKEISYLQFGQPFGNLDTNALNIIRARGAVPHVESLTRLPDGTSFTVTQIAQGQADAYMNSFCTKAKNYTYPFVFRFLWEFNGPWQDTYYGYSTSYAYSRPADYVAAWKRFHGICQQVGATNITWNWNPNWWTTGTSAVDPRPWWPGIDYVDMVGLNGYADGRTLNQIMEKTYPVLTSLSAGKPMYFETGSYEAGAGGSHVPPPGWTKAQWITDMFANLPNYPAFDVLQWFNDGEVGRPSEGIETSPEATAAFKAGIANDRYLPQAQSQPVFTKFPNL